MLLLAVELQIVGYLIFTLYECLICRKERRIRQVRKRRQYFSDHGEVLEGDIGMMGITAG